MAFGGNLGLMPSAYTRELDAFARAMDRSQAIIEFDPDGTVMRANQNFLDLMGYRADDVTGRHHRMFLEQSYAAGEEYRLFWEMLVRGHHQTSVFKRLAQGGARSGSRVPTTP